MPSLATVRSSVKIQRQVDNKLRVLELLPNDAGNDHKNKIKSKHRDPVEELVKNRVAWPNEAILGVVNRTWVTYDQFSLVQWVQGFTCNILDEKNLNKREWLLMYMSELMPDSTDFSWQNTKVAHAVLCCELEREMVMWDDTDRIDYIRHMLVQKHTVLNSKTWHKIDNAKKPWFCKFFQNGKSQFVKDHGVGVRCIGTFVTVKKPRHCCQLNVMGSTNIVASARPNFNDITKSVSVIIDSNSSDMGKTDKKKYNNRFLYNSKCNPRDIECQNGSSLKVLFDVV